MLSVAAAHQHRHLKTLMVLVLAMTGGTLLLFWIARFSPVTPLRASLRGWTRIAVRAETGPTVGGFYHYRVDPTGRLFQSRAWKSGQYERSTPGTIHVLLTCSDEQLRVTPEQARTLSRLLSRLRRDHDISARSVEVRSGGDMADPAIEPADTSRRT